MVPLDDGNVPEALVSKAKLASCHNHTLQDLHGDRKAERATTLRLARKINSAKAYGAQIHAQRSGSRSRVVDVWDDNGWLKRWIAGAIENRLETDTS